MKFCPQCQSVFPEDYVFCMNDGTTLKEEDAEQETVIRPKINDGQANTPSFEMLVAWRNANCQIAPTQNSAKNAAIV